jgi:hypothetical protein
MIRSKDSLNFIIEYKITGVRKRGVEVEPRCMNATMKQFVPSLINQMPNH